MFGLDTLDLLQEPKPRYSPKLRRRLRYAAGAIFVLAVIGAGVAIAQNPPSDWSGLLMFLVAFAINVLISVALGFLAYHASRNRMGL